MDSDSRKIRDALLRHVPADGSSIGNRALLRLLADNEGFALDEAVYWQIRDQLVAEGILTTDRGRGGSVLRAQPAAETGAVVGGEDEEEGESPADDELPLKMQEVVKEAAASPSSRRPRRQTAARGGEGDTGQVLSYRHADKRRNNPHVGMVDTASDGVEGKTTWRYDPHLSPTLQFDVGRARIEKLVDEALAAGDEETMRRALTELKRLQAPYLDWTGKAERTSFEVDTVSLHVHERIDPATILAAVQKGMRRGRKDGRSALQLGLFAAPFENLPLREAIDFYKHERDWANRLIAGDSLLVMNSLIQKESMAGQVQMIYIDPPYGIKYGSNFQHFFNKRDVKDRSDQDLTQEPEMIKAFRDTWELGIHSYLTYLRDRLLLAKELLHESGSVFVQISDENLHLVRNLLDEIFGKGNFLAQIAYVTTSTQGSGLLPVVNDNILWYGQNKLKTKYNHGYDIKEYGGLGSSGYNFLLTNKGEIKRITSTSDEEIQKGRVSAASDLTSSHYSLSESIPFQGKTHTSGSRYWSTSTEGMQRLGKSGRLMIVGSSLRYLRFFDDFPAFPRTNVWTDTGVAGFTSTRKTYVVQTNEKVIERCLLMTTDPGDLVLDPTCGSGTTAFVAEKWGRRWITCDTSRVAVTLAKQRLLTASYDYYDLKYPAEGLKGGFIYKTVPHVTLKSIANNPEIDEIHERMHPAVTRALADLNAALRGQPLRFNVTEGGRKGETLDFAKAGSLQEWEVPFDLPDDWPAAARDPFTAFHAARQALQKKMDESIAGHADQEILYDQPQASKTKLRISGPFTVEAVPFPSVLALDEAEQPADADLAVARSGETSRQGLWRDELLKAGIRGKGGQMLKLAELETLPGLRYIHAGGTVAESGERVAVSFGPEHAALEQRQVEIAMREAGELFPLPRMLVFCAFTFDPEAAKDIDTIRGITALKVQMNTDLLTEDLKKGRANNESFWLMGQPDVEVRRRKDGRYQVEVHGFDYFDTRTGELQSGGKKQIAMWALDTDYDDRSLFPKQVFFPMAGGKEGWYKLKKDIRAELDEDLLERFHGTVSLPFEAGDNGRIAVKIVDDRGIESLKVIDLD